FSGMNPPVVRALVGLVLASQAEHYKLNWSGSITVLFSGFVCLALFPAWWDSLSFLMSWSAAFALTTASSALKKSAAVYIVMLVPMLGLGLNSPATILMNWLMAPILGFILLPVSFLPFIHSSFLGFSDWVWAILIYIISFLSQFSASANATYQIPTFMMWIFLLGLQFALYQYIVTRRKKEL
ncbi:MAG: ComEC/Rec2 family competence protein, partial [Bdellovibrionota bacterium]